MKRTPLFISATGETAGKTLVTLGLMSELTNTFDKVGFIKPLGLARVRAGREGIDIDAALIEKVCGLHENIKNMCPVTLSRTSWPEVSKADAERMLETMKGAFELISKGCDMVVVEGTGYSSLGSSLGLSNADIAHELGCKVLIVAAYGTISYNPFDPTCMNKEFFQNHGVDTVGVIINRVPAELLESYGRYARTRLESLGITLLGVLPEDPRLQRFPFVQILEHLEGEMLCGRSLAEAEIDTVRVGAMTPHRAIEFFTPRSLIITPGDREDLIVTVCACTGRKAGGPAGLVLSGGERPHPRIMELLEQAGIPTFLANEDSYTVASRIHDMPRQIKPNEREKIAAIESMVLEHVEVDRIISAL